MKQENVLQLAIKRQLPDATTMRTDQSFKIKKEKKNSVPAHEKRIKITPNKNKPANVVQASVLIGLYEQLIVANVDSQLHILKNNA